MLELHVALIHHPVFNRNKDIVATTITHFDIHDIARVCRSYGVFAYHLIHPAHEQLMFVERLKEHWTIGSGQEFNPIRAQAIQLVSTAESLDKLKIKEGFSKVYATSAKEGLPYARLTFPELKQDIQNLKTDDTRSEKILIVFGTGSGLTNTVFDQCDALLEPIVGFPGSDFRHLSVRTAVAIILDRIHRT